MANLLLNVQSRDGLNGVVVPNAYAKTVLADAPAEWLRLDDPAPVFVPQVAPSFDTAPATVDYFHSLGTDSLGTLKSWTASEGGGLPALVSNLTTTTARQTSFAGHPDWADMTALVRCSFATGAFTGVAIHSPDGSPINGVRAAIHDNTFQLCKGISGTNTILVTNLPTLVAGTQYWVEVIANGTSYSANVYADSAGAKGALISAIAPTVISDAYSNGYLTLQSTLAGGTFGGAFANVCKVTGPAPTGCTTNLNSASWGGANEPAFCWSKVRSNSGVASVSIKTNGSSTTSTAPYWNTPAANFTVGLPFLFSGWVYVAVAGWGAGGGASADRSGNPGGNRVVTTGSWQQSKLFYFPLVTSQSQALILYENINGTGSLAYWDDATISPSPPSFIDSSGHGRHGMPVNGITTGVPGLIADGDAAVSFDGGSGTMIYPSGPVIGAVTGFSIGAWLNPTLLNHAGGGNAARVFQDTGSVVLLIVFSSGAVQLNFTGCTPALMGTGGNVVKINTRTHVMGTWDGTQGIIYINGLPILTTPTTGALGTIGSIIIGNSSSAGGRAWDGVIDEPDFYTYALGPAQVLAHVQASVRMFLSSTPGARDGKVQAATHDGVAPAQTRDGKVPAGVD